MKMRYFSSIFLGMAILLSLSGGTKPKSKADELREAAEGLPSSTQKIIEEYIKSDAVWDLKVNYIKQMTAK